MPGDREGPRGKGGGDWVDDAATEVAAGAPAAPAGAQRTMIGTGRQPAADPGAEFSSRLQAASSRAAQAEAEAAARRAALAPSVSAPPPTGHAPGQSAAQQAADAPPPRARVAMPMRTEIAPPPQMAQPRPASPRQPAPAAEPILRTEISAPQLAHGTGQTMRTEIASAPPAMTGYGAEQTPATPVVQSERAIATSDQQSGPAPAAALDSLQLSQGIRVKQFELIRELGRGGMGQVFLARDTKLGRLVALKFLTLSSPELTERFLVEARATARCQHENIVVIYEADEWEGQPYMALEYLEGETLSATMKDRTLSPRRAVELILPVVRALTRAHEFNIVHRDLKPDNIFVTRDGVVKVLDFGIAKLFDAAEGPRKLSPEQISSLSNSSQTQDGGIVGTMPYMSPEQWGADSIDHRTDFWALGIIFWQMLTNRHPLDPMTPQRLAHAAALLDQAMPAIGQAMPEIPAALEQIVDRCLAKRKEQRFGAGREISAALEQLMPGRYGRHLEAGESPYPGMSAFQEVDADRFFGRSDDIVQMVQRLREQALVGVVGPSGVGKSSFVRAGVVPALRSSGEEWEILIARPGRDPLAGLATLLQPMASTSSGDAATKMSEHRALVERLRSEPGYLGTLLRARARQKRGNILLFVDQFEELYTLVPDYDVRAAYTACIAGMADDASAPLRVVVSMRSDFLDRAAEDRLFMDQLTRGLLFLPPVDDAGMREALTQPLEMAGFQFESDAIVTDMLQSLADTPGALPLLQFTASKLWDARDRKRQMLTGASYQSLGGLAGALATHADEVLNALPPERQRLTRTLFQRLVTSDGTRAIVDVAELLPLSQDASSVQSVVDHLVQARLLVVQSRGELDGPAVEIVHESLIQSWPTLRRWLEENQEDSAFLEQLRSTAKQWDSRSRPVGLLWRGEAMDEARRFERRFKGELPAREREFLAAVLTLASKSARRKRRLVIGAFVVLLGVVAAAMVALLFIRDAQQEAVGQRELADQQKVLAQAETKKAQAAQAATASALATVKQQIETIKNREDERDAAQTAAEVAEQKAKTGERKLKMTDEQLEVALARAQKERAKAEKAARTAAAAQKLAEKAAAAEKRAKEKTKHLLVQEQKKNKRLREERKKLSTKLK